ELWANCVDSMLKAPFFGIGPFHFPLISHTYGWLGKKEGHTLWLQIGAELGIPGLAFLGSFYLLCQARLWPLAMGKDNNVDPWLQGIARMVIASIGGFIVAAQFISLVGLELPYYVVLLGAGVLRLTSLPPIDQQDDNQTAWS